MSIFARIKDAIFGASAKAAPAPASSAAPKPTATAAPKPAAAPASAPPAPAPAAAPVDVEAVLQQLAANQKQPLNWRTSIVDLMKLVGLDSSLENRKELARELGYKGDTNDSATMNIWLHKQVMNQLAAHGGKVPAELKD
jgi:3-oxoacyl-ACP reductase-like protein